MSFRENDVVFRPFDEADVPHLVDTINSAFAADKFFKYPEYYDRASSASLYETLRNQKQLFCTLIAGELQMNDKLGENTGNVEEVCGSSNVPCCSTVTHIFELALTIEDSQQGMTKIISKRVHLSNIASGSVADLLGETEDLETVGDNTTLKDFSLRYTPSISCVSVNDKYQGRGLGKLLLRRCEEYIRAFLNLEGVEETVKSYCKGFLASVFRDRHCVDALVEAAKPSTSCIVIHLEVLLEVRPELGPFYTKLGYGVVGSAPFSASFICLPEYKFNSILMEKSIAASSPM